MSLPRFPGVGRLFSASAWSARPAGVRFTGLCRPANTVARRTVRLRPPRTSRQYSTEPPPKSTAPPTPSTKEAAQASRLDRVLSRLPKSLQKYTRRLKDAPVSHVVAFLILHEITAIVPLVGLFGLFHWAGAGSGGSGSGGGIVSKLVPLDYMTHYFGGLVVEGVRRFEKYFRRKGWFGFSRYDEDADSTDEATTTDAVMRKWASADSKYRIVVEVGLAYSITKVLLPLRIVLSLWATPWFAGVLVRLRGLRRKA
ncbi:hypothetical protein HMPREF1624_03841 [Sporothrix schenckii ATCC 58251]|uniref:Uncharacterized protein n=1 Tax=Sporothrix schenckii (strain ATCC 58251 / de Perez 2211183) TaxID=1391915 RepID=U7PY13_SPOS1|nr:hypothetical protein HMPREF1624_03841 [Sporothrix schenckii ATCC 58251]